MALLFVVVVVLFVVVCLLLLLLVVVVVCCCFCVCCCCCCCLLFLFVVVVVGCFINDHVWAAGDATDFPLKQGGIATQQADVAARSIAARAGAPVGLERFSPLLRGILLTGRGAWWLRNDPTGGAGEGDLAGHALWWPPSKIAGRWLSPYLAKRDEGAAGEPPRGTPLEVRLSHSAAPAGASASSAGRDRRAVPREAVPPGRCAVMRERSSRPRVVIAGGGVAAVEALLALRELAGQHVAHRAARPGARVPSPPVVRGHPVRLRRAGAARYRRPRRRARREGPACRPGGRRPRSRRRAARRRGRDRLRPARGGGRRAPARRRSPARSGSPVLRTPPASKRCSTRSCEATRATVVFTRPGPARRGRCRSTSSRSWQRSSCATAAFATRDLTVVTPEREPLWLFGLAASRAVRELLAQRGVALRTSGRARAAHGGVLELEAGSRWPPTRSSRSRRSRARASRASPANDGRIPAASTRTGASSGLATSTPPATRPRFPIKQGGLATQQADAVAEALAVDLGFRAPTPPVPPRAARPSADGRRAALPARGARARRRGPSSLVRAGGDRRTDVLESALVAAEQDRRTLPRALPRAPPALGTSGTSRCWTAPRSVDPGAPTATTRSSWPS